MQQTETQEDDILTIDPGNLLHQPTASHRHSLLPQTSDHLHRPISPSSNATASPSRASSPAPSVASNAASGNDTPTQLLEALNDLDPPPKWTGCLSFSCPQHRAVGDHRRRCTAVLKECLSCQILVCSKCVGNMENPCTCDGCKGDTNTNSSDTENRFWCPNCRWDRERNGKCKKRDLEVERKNKIRETKAKFRWRKSLTAIDANTDLSDDSMQMVGEYLEYLRLRDLRGSSENIGGATAGDANGDNRQESRGRDLERMRTRIHDVMKRLQRLTERFAAEDRMGASTEVVAGSSSAAPRVPPVVEDMD